MTIDRDSESVSLLMCEDQRDEVSIKSLLLSIARHRTYRRDYVLSMLKAEKKAHTATESKALQGLDLSLQGMMQSLSIVILIGHPKAIRWLQKAIAGVLTKPFH